jgi:hypothetical protein
VVCPIHHEDAVLHSLQDGGGQRGRNPIVPQPPFRGVDSRTARPARGWGWIACQEKSSARCCTRTTSRSPRHD